MRRWLLALAEPNRIAAQVLTSNPMKVSTLGLMRESASQRTMVSSRTPQARPKADVQLMEDECVIAEACGPASGFRLSAPGKRAPEAGRRKDDGKREPSSRLRPLGSLAVNLLVDGAELQDFQSALAVGRDDDGFVPHFFVEQGAPNGRGGGNLSGCHVRFLAGHELVFQ